jgi:hypothetical protein
LEQLEIQDLRSGGSQYSEGGWWFKGKEDWKGVKNNEQGI